MGGTGIAANLPCGAWREHTKKFSPQWFLAVHATIPFVAMLRKAVLMPKWAILLTLAGSSECPRAAVGCVRCMHGSAAPLPAACSEQAFRARLLEVSAGPPLTLLRPLPPLLQSPARTWAPDSSASVCASSAPAASSARLPPAQRLPQIV